MNKEKHFINLTNGIQAIEDFQFENPRDLSFIRIQSCHCERQMYEQILIDLDNNFLMYAAMGYTCKVYDYGARCEISKANATGLEWIRYVLNRRWFKKIITPVVKGKNVSDYFYEKYKGLSYRTKRKIDYFKKFINTNEVKIISVANATDNDNKPDYFISVIESNF